MKQTITFTDFQTAFHNMGRGDQFTYLGLRALFEGLEEMETECGTDTELDVIALCCQFSEYDTLEEYNQAYDEELEDWHEADTITFPIERSEGAIVAEH